MSRSVGEFTLVGHLGEGSFATVFLARQRETGREFAMKAISRARVQGKLQENLESEISILKSFRHGNIVELYDIKKTERHIYLVLEYCAGGDLRALIRKEGSLAEPSARHFMRDLGSGLHFLWSKHLVHRDLKPQNLLLTGLSLDATLKIADFGFARHLAQASMAETICGSPLYMAPEILQGHKYDAKADLWSVGAILYEMLAGKPPFGGQNQIQLLANIRRGPTPPARDGFYPLPEGVPRPGRPCNDLLCRLLVPDPQHRASFREFFQSDVLRSTPAAAAAAGAGSGGSGRSGGTEGGGRRESATGQPSAGTVDRDARTPDRDPAPISSSGAIAYSSSGQQQQLRPAGTNQPRGGRDAPWSPAAVSGGNRGQQHDKATPRGGGGGGGGGGWWPLQGWRWGGGGGGNAAAGAGARARGPPEEDGRFMPLSRTFSEPPVVAQRTRLQTPPSRRAGEYLGQHVAGSGGRPSSRQWGGTPQQSVPSRPPLTPPSPAQGSGSSYSRRGSRGGVRPIPIRQQQQHQHQHQQGSSTRGSYEDRDAQESDPWSHGDGDTGASGNPSSQWSRYGDGDEGDMPPSQAYEPRQRLRSNGPNSAPEVSYMGYAASRARERGAAAAAAAAAGLRGVAFSLVGDSPPHSARDSPQGSQPSSTPRRDSLGLRAPDVSPGGSRHSRPPSLDLGGRAPEPQQLRGAATAAAAAATTSRGGGQVVAVTSPAAKAAAAAVATATSAESFQALSSSPPDTYPIQLAAMVAAGRQRMWGGAGGLRTAGSGGDVGGNPTTGFAYQVDAVVGVVAGAGAGGGARGAGGFDRRGVKGRLNDEALLQQQQQQQYHQQQQGGRPADNSDGSGGSDDFVLVDGVASSDQNAGQAGAAGGGHLNPAYRSGGDVDPRSLGPRLVAAGGKWVWGGCGQVAFGLQQELAPRVGPADAQGVGDGRGGVAGAVPPLSLEGVLRCLQIVELFGRRAVLLAELGDSRVAPAMRCRQKSSLGMSSRTGGRWGGAGHGKSDAQEASFTRAPGGNFCAFSQDKPPNTPLFAEADDPWLPSSSSSIRGPTSDGDGSSSYLGSRSAVAGGASFSGPTSSSAACCDSHRLFGEALVLYLKSLSMAKEAIVWGNQALESLPVAAAAAAAAGSSSSSSSSSSRNQSQNQPPPPPSPHALSPGVSSPAGAPEPRSQGLGEGYTSPQGPSSSPPPPPAAAADGTASSSSSSSASLSSEAQVVAWGSSLLRWLTGQFSAVLRRAERCRTELRGSTPAAATEASPAASFARTTTAAGTGLAVDAQGLNATAATSFPVDVSPSRAAGNGGGRRSTAGGGSGLDGALVSASPERSSALVSTGGDGGGGGHGQAAPAEQHGHAHGAAPAAVAVSARDIVVKSALAMVKESAASEVLGMWEPARKGYEKAALLLETLLLDALVARPEAAAAGPGRSAAGGGGGGGGGGQSGTASPKVGWSGGGVGGGGAAGAPGDSLIASGSRGGVLSEADQRVLQNYMTRFARRAADVAAIEKEEARVAAGEATTAVTIEP